MRVRIACWAWKYLVRPYVRGYRWEIGGSNKAVYAGATWALDPDDVEPVL